MSLDNLGGPKSPSVLSRYALGVGIGFLAIVLRIWLTPFLGKENLYHTAWAAVALSAWYCGLGPSILTALTAVIGNTATRGAHEDCVIGKINQLGLLDGLRRSLLQFSRTLFNLTLHILIEMHEQNLTLSKRLLGRFRPGPGSSRRFPERDDEAGKKHEADHAGNLRPAQNHRRVGRVSPKAESDHCR